MSHSDLGPIQAASSSRAKRGTLLACGIWICAALALTACGSAPLLEAPLRPGDHAISVESEGLTRTYLLHLPDVRGPAETLEPLPLLIAFHGGGGNAKGFQRYAGLDDVADREGFAVAYPNGSPVRRRRWLTWNAGLCCGAAMRDGVDDVAFARALVANLQQHLPIDLDRVYATGHSNGAMMAYRLGVEAPDLVAAIAPVAGAMSLPPGRGPTRALPVLHIHSVDDPRALYDGGLGPPFPLTRVRVEHAAVETTLSEWIQSGGCASEPSTLETRRSDRGHTATHLRYGPCVADIVVELWKLTGAGHGWPGQQAELPERIVGENTDVIDAASEVWSFVSRFARASD